MRKLLPRFYVPCLALSCTAAPAQIPATSIAPLSVSGHEIDVPLWRDLVAGQTTQEVSAKLLKYPEVKAVKLKASKKGAFSSLIISMNQGGVPVYGSAFAVTTGFDSISRLTDVTLVSSSECANGAVEKFQKISSALAEKYGSEVTGRSVLDKYMAVSALLKSY